VQKSATKLFKMLEKVGLPLNKSLFSLLEDGTALDDIPFLFSMIVEDVVDSTSATHSSQLHIPLMATVRSLDVNSVMIKTDSGATSRKVYLLLQRQHFNGEPRGPPIPLAITDTTQCTVSARFKLHAGDHLRLLLIQRGCGAAVREIVFNGFLLQSPDSFFASNTPPAALASWAPEPFKIMEGEPLPEPRKRSRSPEQQTTKTEDTEDEIPTLVYAPVHGGDDES
jgi:hypothetical protein